MKKLIAMALLAITVLTFASCGGKFTCDECGEEKIGKSHKIELAGEKAVMCPDCYEENKELIEGLKALADAFGGLN